MGVSAAMSCTRLLSPIDAPRGSVANYSNGPSLADSRVTRKAAMVAVCLIESCKPNYRLGSIPAVRLRISK